MKDINVFPGFNSLRFIAAYLVLTTHIELIRAKFHLFNLLNYPIINEGGIAVEIFFVLSGFLITYLLLKEYQKDNTISIKKFYARRVLRIWPLYYIIVFLGLIIIPFLIKYLHIDQEMKIPFYPSILLYICMLPNLVMVIYGSSFLSPLWSIGIEEQFYILWAPVFKFFKKNFLVFLFSVIVVRISLQLLLVPYLKATGTSTNVILADFIETMKFECMAIGALGAILLFSEKFSRYSKTIFSYVTQIIMYLYFITLFTLRMSQWKHYIGFLDNTIVHSLFVQLFLFNLSLNPKSIVKLKSKIVSYLGEISYGIYMYHSIVVFGIIYLLKDFLLNMNPILSTFIIYGAVSFTVFLVAFLSFRVVEKPILRFKKYF